MSFLFRICVLHFAFSEMFTVEVDSLKMCFVRALAFHLPEDLHIGIYTSYFTTNAVGFSIVHRVLPIKTHDSFFRFAYLEFYENTAYIHVGKQMYLLYRFCLFRPLRTVVQIPYIALTMHT